MTEIKVNRKAAGRVASGHPWIFSSDVVERDNAAPGSVVKVVDHQGRGIGTAHYSSTSQICLRLLSTEIHEVDREFFARLVAEAEKYRRLVVRDTDLSVPPTIVRPRKSACACSRRKSTKSIASFSRVLWLRPRNTAGSWSAIPIYRYRPL